MHSIIEIKEKGMRIKKFYLSLFFIFYLIAILGCDKSEINKLHSENNALKNQINKLKNENLRLKSDIEKLKNPPNKLYSNALNNEKKSLIKKAQTDYEKIIEWFPESKEAKLAKNRLTILEKEIEESTTLSNFMDELNNKFSGSSQAEVLSTKILNNNLIISAKHSICDYYDAIFIDIGVTGHRYSRINDLKFNKIILELHCDANSVKRYYINKTEFSKYINLSINDPQLIALIKRL